MIFMFESKAGKKLMGLDTGEIKFEVDPGDWDEIAFQIGFHPFMRCAHRVDIYFQCGQMLPCRKT